MTDRVEINPDNTNKPLEQSQEDLAKQGINVNESQVNANGESINISEPDNKVQSSEDEARPNWLPEKFASAEELAKAYGELEKKMSSPKEEVPESVFISPSGEIKCHHMGPLTQKVVDRCIDKILVEKERTS